MFGPIVTLNLASPMTLTLDFQSQTWKLLYLRNGRADLHTVKGMRIARMLDLICDLELWPWPWIWIFKAKFWKKPHLRNGSVWPWTSALPMTLKLNLRYSSSNFVIAVFQQWVVCLIWNKRDMNRQHDVNCVTLILMLLMTVTLDFQGKILKITESKESPQILL